MEDETTKPEPRAVRAEVHYIGPDPAQDWGTGSGRAQPPNRWTITLRSGSDFPTSRDQYPPAVRDPKTGVMLDRRAFTFDFWTGSAWRPVGAMRSWKPENRGQRSQVAVDALASVLGESPRGETFEDWAEGLGMDTDSRKAEAMFRAVIAQTEKVAHVLGLTVAELETLTEAEYEDDPDLLNLAGRLLGEVQ